MQSIKLNALLLLLILIAFTACEDLESFNENPNAPTIDQASPELILPKILYEVGDHQTSSLAWGTGNILVQ
ncbi:MAG: hypothetical protein AAFQ37_00930 [Bacteroidota bacterium]